MHWSLRLLWVWMLCLAAALPAAAATATAGPAAAAAIVTILDGDASLVRDAARSPLTEGVRLQATDIVDSSDKARLVRLEFGNGTVVDMGPATRLIVLPKLTGDKTLQEPLVYVLQGWVKWGAAKTPVADAALAAPGLSVADIARSVVVQILPPAPGAAPAVRSFVFAESGSASVRLREGKQVDTLPLKSGEFYAGGGTDKPKVLPRPNPRFNEFIQGIPRTFTDSLPLRSAVWKDKPVALKPGSPVTYGDVEAWLHTEAPLRPSFMPRFKGRLQDAEFKRAMASNVAQHPEWDRTLFPEKYRPKPAPVPPPAVKPMAAPASVPIAAKPTAAPLPIDVKPVTAPAPAPVAVKPATAPAPTPSPPAYVRKPPAEY